MPTTGRLRAMQFVKYCIVGGSGVLVDMAVLHLLAVQSGWNISLSKFCSAESALLNNFVWNELWTFANCGSERKSSKGLAGRLVKFHGICGIGLLLAVLLLTFFHGWCGINLYVANFMSILLVTFWNFWMNATFNWRVRAGSCRRLK